MSKNKLIRNSTAEFLIFTAQDGKNSIEARYEDETIWLTQKLMGELFEVGTNTINYHLKEIFKSDEIEKNRTIRKFRIVQLEGSRQVERSVDFYNLDAIISVGYRVNSVRATQFRQWATKVLKEFAIKGFVLDKKRLENGSYLNKDYFEELLAEIREFVFLNVSFIKRLLIFMQQVLITTRIQPSQKSFLQKYKTSCITVFTEILPQSLFIKERIVLKIEWD